MDGSEAFEELRPRLFGIAYRMLGDVSAAEDAVQESWLRLRRAHGVDSIEGFLVTAVTRICIDEHRSARARREQYVGPWLPEPLAARSTGADPASRVETTECLSLALLCVLESLNATERAVFLLREVFGYEYGAIARVVGKRADHCRQIARRARARVRERRPRVEAAPGEHRRLLDAFLAASAEGDLEALESLLAEDVVLTPDSGGLAPAARRPVRGASNVARFMVGITRKAPAGASVRLIELNGLPAALVSSRRGPEVAVALDVADGRVREVMMVRNPEKLAGLAAGA